MARRPAPSAIHRVRRQLAAVRRRWNARVAADALLLAATALATAAAVLVVAAVRESPQGFAVAAGVVAVATAGAAALAVRRTARRWLRRRDAAFTVDRRAALRGRLATLAEVAPERSAFGALLVAETTAGLPAWTPRTLVPRVVPRVFAGAAACAVVALAVVVALAPHLRPPPPEIVAQDEPVTLEPIAGAEDLPHRVVVAPVRRAPRRPGAAGRDGADDGAGAIRFAGGPGVASRSMLERMQAGIRTRLVGETGPRASVASADGESGDDANGKAGDELGDGRGGRKGDAPPGGPTSRPGATTEPAAVPDGTGQTPDPSPRRLLEAARDGDPAGGPGRGAGTATDGRLFGAPSDPDAHGAGTFALALDADVHGGRGSAPAPDDAAPAPALDQHPALGARQRVEAPVPRVPVPAAWEPLVARVFSHPEVP